MNALPRIAGPHLTAIGSGKGGTGKTLIAVSLAHALAHEGERVLLVDADLGLSNTAIHLGLESGGDLEGVVAGTACLADAAVPILGGTSTRGGFDLLAAPAGSGALANADAAMADRLMSQLRAARCYDRVLLDLAAGVDRNLMAFAAAADDTLLILTPDPASLTDAYAFSKLYLRSTGTRLPLVLVNMAASESEARRTAEALAATCRAFLKVVPPYLGSVPRDTRAVESVRRQCQLLTLYPQAPAACAVVAVAQKLHVRIGPGAAPVAVPSLR
jgi:flagellar biosynthesis protein FlhG